MFWLDRIFGQIEKELKEKIASGKILVVRDEKTASGRVHVGSMRALALHAALADRLDEAKIPHVFKYEINDMDPMDGLPVYLDKKVYEKEMGKPLFAIPSPDLPAQAGGKAKNFAEYFAAEYIEAIKAAGFNPELYRTSELYLSGKMDDAIRLALERADVVRRIYKEVSGAKRANDWYPLSVICEACGKVGTTQVYAWDGAQVSYRCLPEAVEWAKGCGHEGKVSPFGGSAKLPWKVEWAAKWMVVGVDIEGGGKDHYSKGGARDVARRVAQEVFEYPEPFGVANEFFLVGGKKMSSSKGEGSSAKEIVELVPPHIFRLALYGKDINQQINFDPAGDTIPTLYDQYDKLAAGYWAGTRDDYARLFEYIHKERVVPGEHYLPRFSQVAFMVQMPHLNLHEDLRNLKGSRLSDEDLHEAEERSTYAKKWLETYAPEKYVFKLQDELPEVLLSEQQKTALALLADYVESEQELSGERLHHRLHELKDERGIAPGEFFGAIYQIFLNKRQGPQAGWFLASLPHEFVLKRLKKATE
jgi:lysyl-tRNA synthetase class 1